MNIDDGCYVMNKNMNMKRKGLILHDIELVDIMDGFKSTKAIGQYMFMERGVAKGCSLTSNTVVAI